MVQTHHWCIKTKSPCYNDDDTVIDDTVIDDIGFMKTTATSNGEDVHERERERESKNWRLHVEVKVFT